MVLTVSQLAKQLGITYQGALKKLKSNEEQLKPYLKYNKKGGITGIDEQGLEVVLRLPYRTNKITQDQEARAKGELAAKDEIIKSKQEFINELLKDKEELKAKVNSLEAELEAYKTGGFLVRLLGYKKKQ